MAEFKNILGNENIIDHMLNAYRQKKVSHAYIIEGERGSGKKLLAESFAKLLLCEKGGEVPCGQCTSCIQMETMNHPDVIRVKHAKPATISVDDIREQIVGTADVMPYKGPYKIYIVDEAEKMNAQAQNAVLKTIEEPPPYVVILLLTSNRGTFLPTILSRCILLMVRPVSDSLVRKHLTDHCEVSKDLADFCTKFAMGNIGRAMECAQSEDFAAMRDLIIDLMKKVSDITPKEAEAGAKDLSIYKNNIQDCLDMMTMWFRDILFMKTVPEGEESPEKVFQKEYSVLYQQSERLSLEDLNRIFLLLQQTRKRLRANVSFEMTLEMTLLEIQGYFS